MNRLHSFPVLAFFLAVSAALLPPARGQMTDPSPSPAESGVVSPLQGNLVDLNREKKTATVDLGREHGVVPGMIFQVYGAGEVIRLPLTGDEIVRKPAVIGRIRIGTVGEKRSEGVIYSDRNASEIQNDAVVIGFPIPREVNLPPEILRLTPSSPEIAGGDRLQITAEAQDHDGEPLEFRWEESGGRLNRSLTLVPTVQWTAPIEPGEYTIRLAVTDPRGMTANAETKVKVLPPPEERRKQPYRKIHSVTPVPPFESLVSAAYDRNNRLFLVDPRSRRICRISPDRMQTDYFGETGREPGQFVSPTVCVTHEDTLLVIDTGRYKVLKFGTNGNFLSEFGERGTGNGQFSQPSDLAVSAEGDVYVLDAESRDIQMFSPQGKFILRLGWTGDQPGQFRRPVALTGNRRGDLFILDMERRKVIRLDKNHRFVREYDCGSASDLELNREENALYLLYPEEKTIRRLSLESGAFDPAFPPPASMNPGVQELFLPVALCTDRYGNVAVVDADSRLPHLTRFSPEGRFLDKLGGEEYNRIFRIAADSQGNLFCLSEDTQVRKLSRAGWTLARFGGRGFENGFLRRPEAIGVAPDDSLWVVDSGRSQLVHYDPRGRHLSSHGGSGNEPGKLRRPVDLSIREGKIRVLDVRRNRLLEFGLDGAFLEELQGGTSAEDPNDLRRFRQITVDGDGHLHASLKGYRIRTFRNAGITWVNEWGERGKGPGQFQEIQEIQTDGEGFLWVLDRRRGDLQRFHPSIPSGDSFLTGILDPEDLPAPHAFTCDRYNDLYVYDREKARFVIYSQ